MFFSFLTVCQSWDRCTQAPALPWDGADLGGPRATLPPVREDAFGGKPRVKRLGDNPFLFENWWMEVMNRNLTSGETVLWGLEGISGGGGEGWAAEGALD